MTHTYVTILTANYLVQALCLWRSLESKMASKRFAFYCVDEISAQILSRLDIGEARVIRHDEFVAADVVAVRGQRQLNEYCWTCKGSALKHALADSEDGSWAVIVDGDMIVFDDPNEGLSRAGDANVIITPHHYSMEKFSKYAEIAGWHNAGYIAFRNTSVGRAALDWWHGLSIELCSAVPKNGTLGEQVYLDWLGPKFQGVYSSEHKGLNAGPWSIDGYEIKRQGGSVFLDSDALLIYHCQGLRAYGPRLVDLYTGPHKLPPAAVREIYLPYIRAVQRAVVEVRQVDRGVAAAGFSPIGPRALKNFVTQWAQSWSNLTRV